MQELLKRPEERELAVGVDGGGDAGGSGDLTAAVVANTAVVAERGCWDDKQQIKSGPSLNISFDEMQAGRRR